MAGGPSLSTATAPVLPNNAFVHSSFGVSPSSSSSSSSPPNQPFPARHAMAPDGFAGSVAGVHHQNLNLSAMSERKAGEKSHPILANGLASANGLGRAVGDVDQMALPTIFMRKLPRSITDETLRSMLLFAKDLVDAEFVPAEFPEDKGFLSAVARFRTLAGAHEARDRLNGKANASNDANMIVQVLQTGVAGNIGARRNTIDAPPNRHASASISSNGSANGAPASRSRFNGTFQNLERVSPPGSTPSVGTGEFPVPDSSAHFQNLFSPQSPLGNPVGERPRMSGKSMINDDAADDETGELLKDPVAYARSGQSGQTVMPRRTTNPQPPVSRFAGLSLSTPSGTTSVSSPSMSAFATPRSAAPVKSPVNSLGTMSPNSPPGAVPGLGPNSTYQLTQPYPRHNYPPVNPADQNPPCNTLYVGNLPIDTSEDELKAMFSKQRGYKRLCFRTKQNGPMCFVEFEDVSFATKALNELYGYPLHNSVKGGIRLSFSKNPLGVRTGQTNSLGPGSAMASQSAMPGVGGAVGVPPGFSTASGPPPGLSAPPGLTTPLTMGMSPAAGSGFGMFGGPGYDMPGSAMAGAPRVPPLASNVASTVAGGGYAGMGGTYSAYMMGR